MALTVVAEPPPPPAVKPEPFEPPPPIITTPCDPWPRPYFLEDGLRKVVPYHYTYNTYCKERWRGRPLLEIFSTEFRDRPTEYYKNAIETGEIAVNGKSVESVDTIILNGDIISHTLHRHEPPVTAQPIGIVHEDNDMIVINKPAGVPVHPAGRYNYNSIVEIMRAARGPDWNPLPCNRLDRLTSGIMFVGKHARAAEELGQQIKERTVRKEYVARVIGEFPDGEVVCDQPILQISPKLGLNRARASGKEARTIFKRLAYYPAKPKPTSPDLPPSSEPPNEPQPPNSTPSSNPLLPANPHPWRTKTGYSIVRCLPLTGRTHQLRVHLQFLGHPISNDPIYSNQRVFGSNLGAFDSSPTNDEDIITRLSRMGKDEVASAVAYHDEMVTEYNKRKAEKMSGEQCKVCGTELYTDPGAHELGIYLHALRYSDAGGGWDYRTELPGWALPPEGVEGPKEVGTEGEKELESLAEEVEKMGIIEGTGVVVNGEKVSTFAASEETSNLKGGTNVHINGEDQPTLTADPSTSPLPDDIKSTIPPGWGHGPNQLGMIKWFPKGAYILPPNARITPLLFDQGSGNP